MKKQTTQGSSPAKAAEKMTDMTQGNPYKLILLFSLPLLIGNALQQLYNMVDSIVVGNVIGEKALAAVGTGFPIIFMLSALFMGIGTGATIMIAQYYGAKDLQKVDETANTIYTAMIVGVIPLSLIGILASEPLLRLIRVPDDGTLEMAKLYMMVIFAGMIGNLGFNVNSGILQGLGDSKTSLLFLGIATVINIVLDLVFVFLGMGVMGVALATIIAQISSWIFGIFYINRHYTCVQLRPLRFFFHRELFQKAMKLGIPSGIQQALFSIGTMMMQSLVNSYGSAFMAGFNGANKIDSFAFMPIMSFSTAITTYTGQNVGAGNQERIDQGTKAGLILSGGLSIVLTVVLFPLSGLLMRMFSQNPSVIEGGEAYLHTVLPFYFLLAFSFILNGVLRGAGEMMVPLISSMIGLWLARIPSAYLLAHLFGQNSIFYSYGIGWILSVLFSGIYVRKGKWKNKGIVSRSQTQKD